MTNLVQFKRMLMSCLKDWGRLGPLPPSLNVYATVRTDSHSRVYRPILQRLQINIVDVKESHIVAHHLRYHCR